MGKTVLAACLILTTLILTPLPQVSASSPLKVAASTPSLAGLAEALGGSRVEVLALIPMGADPHHYEPSQPELVEALTGADLILLTGPGHLVLEERIRELAEAGVVEAEILDYMDYREGGLRFLENPGTGEPNVHGYYFSLEGLRVMARVVAEEFIRIDPEGRAVYEANLERYLSLLDSIHEASSSLLMEKPRVILLTPILHYVMRDLGVEVEWIMLPEPDVEPSESDVGRLLGYAEEGYILVVSDLAAERHRSLLQLLDRENMRYVVVPILRLADKPHLITLTTALKLIDMSPRTRAGGFSGTSLLAVSLTANTILIILLILFYRRLRKVG